ncbi:receptor-like serine/threonine-protein kinase SD1-8 isoform X2 [Silene latifolia]|uniref:receptor-like serine/threonine-protein kinase SD1-8 isoform X2 n=1 Tax=Silene latifolia TaxID=37657 RepID=UPI003D77B2A9
MRVGIFSIFFQCFLPVFVASIDILTTYDSLSVNQTLISAGGKFELGFFQKGIPNRYYVGIWYKDIPSDVKIWVANRDSPSYCESTTFRLGNQSNIVLLEGESQVVWKTNQTNGVKLVNPVLQLLDSGNLVMREAGDPNPANFIWQSFDYPTDTLVPGQKLGWNRRTGLVRVLTSWRDPEDPGTGNFSFLVDYNGDPELYLKNVDQIIHRSGPWVGNRFSGVPEMGLANQDFNFTFFTSADEVYYTISLLDCCRVHTRLVVTFEGLIVRWIWLPCATQWIMFWHARKDPCDDFDLCGPYGICNVSESFHCKCPNGFMPKNSNAWGLTDWSNGCFRNTRLDCDSDGFLPLDNIKLPKTSNVFVDTSSSLDQCRDMCKKNCSCTAYANSKFVNGVGSGCIIWTNNLMDMRNFLQGGQTLYMRLASSDLGSLSPNGSAMGKDVVIIKLAIGIGIIVVTTLITGGLITLIIRKRRTSRNIQTGELDPEEINLFRRTITCKTECSEEALDADDVDLPIFNLDSMVAATDNFSEANKLGQGGFGCVYKGVMLDGQEVAVKRLSKDSGQGLEEFKNEVRLISKLQHRNLVRLLGCCVDLDEKMIIYEYLKNRSLDSILFHMNPKISDFGMARIFGGNETEGNTMKVVGTYGYMAPEFAMDGLFSIKSDVFSFGVLVLEILSGTKNRRFFNSDNELNLLGYSWKQWREGKEKELLDKSMGETYSIDEALRCLQVGLLCVQEKPEDRPTMGSVVLMLSSESMSLPQPIFPGRNHDDIDSSSF